MSTACCVFSLKAESFKNWYLEVRHYLGASLFLLLLFNHKLKGTAKGRTVDLMWGAKCIHPGAFVSVAFSN